jgi:glutamine synthetase
LWFVLKLFTGGGAPRLHHTLSTQSTTLIFSSSSNSAKPEDFPIWNYDGSSCGQAPGADSEVYLKPVATYPDPFRPPGNLLVLCEACLPDKALTPIPTNTRRAAKKLFEKKLELVPWFGIEQEYTMFENDGRTPFGWPKNGFPAPQGPYYCSVGSANAFGRRVVEAHYRACLYAGINISGVNAEVMAGQWEYQVGSISFYV